MFILDYRNGLEQHGYEANKAFESRKIYLSKTKPAVAVKGQLAGAGGVHNRYVRRCDSARAVPGYPAI